MSVGQSLRVLNLYDVLTDLIPGVTVVGSLFLYLQISFTVELALFVLLSGYLTGHVLQFLRGYLPGGNTFQEFMKSLRDNRSLSQHPFNEITEVQQDFVDICWDKFELSENYDDYGELFKLLLSYLETCPAKRALRFQAIYSFYRSMVVALICTSLLAASIFLLHSQNQVSIRSEFILFATIGFSILFAAVFYKRKQYFENKFVHYVILDFYQDHQPRENNSE